MYESKDKMVSHPDHYQSESGLEVIDVIKAFTSDLKGIEATDTGNIIKYACRWKRKNGIQDLEKIIWYAQHLIDHLKATTKDKSIFETRKEAEEFLTECDNVLNEYGYLSVADVKILMGDNTNVIGDSYIGWTDLTDAKVVKIAEGYIVVFPKETKFSKKETN